MFCINFNLFYEKTSISKQFDAVLCKVDIDFFNNYIEHKDKAKLFFITSFIRMMKKHKVRMMNNDLKPSFDYKNIKYSY
ncbi:unnamed protein product [Larinioides sclopetarius]|uniref:Uncharacterized protein n=1 Tax=Larinioides sclopetarius TaxID=280406 RepID=A0AAV2BFK6_9ARAC